MKEKEILSSIKKSVDKAPVDLLDKIKDSPRTKMIRHDHITKQEKAGESFRRLMPYASLAAAFVMVVLGWQLGTRTPYSQVYIDVNPSVQIVTNRQDKVIGLEADDIDGRMIIQDLEYRGKTMFQVTDEILERMLKESYLEPGREFLLLSVFNKNDEKAEEQKDLLDDRIHEYLESVEFQPIVLAQRLDNTSTIEAYAKEYGISVSRMTFIRNLIILNPELQVEDLVGLTIEELVRLSRGMGLDLEKIIDSRDLERIRPVEPEPEPEPQPQPEPQPSQGIISPDQALSIALSIANGTITDFEYDDDDLEYEIEIEANGLEYEIKIDARTGAVLEVEIDD